MGNLLAIVGPDFQHVHGHVQFLDHLFGSMLDQMRTLGSGHRRPFTDRRRRNEPAPHQKGLPRGERWAGGLKWSS